jgi:subtilisin-like proprotein convertase family protein
MRKPFRVALFVCLLLPGVPLFAGEDLSPTHAGIRDLIVEELLDGDTAGARVVASPVPLEPKRDELVWTGGDVDVPPGTAWIAVVDLMPGHLGWHPVEHVFLDSALTIIEIRDARFYPRYYRDGRRQSWVTLVAFRAAPGQVPPDREPATSAVTDGTTTDFSYNEHYAVIIEGDVPSGSSYSEFWSDNVRMFRILLEYGYHEDNIHVLYGEGHDETDFNCDYYHEEMVDYPADKQDVRNIFTWMRDGNADEGIKQVTDQDFIYLFTFDHGGSHGGCDATLGLMDGAMDDTEFASYFNDIPYKHRGIVMQQCHSGGFIDNLENETTAISTAANCTESAWEADERDDCGGGVDVKYGEWNYWWMSAMEGHLPWPGEEPVDADTNLDGKVSFLEAHNYALANDDRNEHPQWSDLGGIGDEISLVTSWSGVHLTHLEHELDDAGGGNGDGVADAGETHVMPVTLENVGEEDSTGASATLSTTNGWITIQDDHATYPDMVAGGGAATSYPDHYTWMSAPDTPDDTRVLFTLDWTSNGGAESGVAQFYETIVRVVLQVYTTSIDDAEGGNGDGIADPGETVRLAITLSNKGHALARDVHGVLSTDSPWAAVTDDEADFPDIPGRSTGRSLPPHFELEIAPDTPDKTWIECNLEVTAADGYSFTLPVRFMVGSRGSVLLVEDGDPDNADMLELLVGDLGFGVVRQLASETDPDGWRTYSMLVWASGGSNSPCADADLRDALESYVADGGRLLIEGGELGYDHRYNKSFRENVLHMSSWSRHDAGDLAVRDDDHPLATVPHVLEDTIPEHGGSNAERDSVRAMADATIPVGWTNHSGEGSLVAFDDDDLEGNGGQIASLFVATRVIENELGQRDQLIDNALEWLLGNDRPYLVHDGYVAVDDELGNGDGIVDPGELITLEVNLANHGSGVAHDTWARAASDQPAWIEFVDNYADWPVIGSGDSMTSLAPHLQLRVAEDTPCGTPVVVTLDITTAEGFTGSRWFSFTVGTGGGQHVTYEHVGENEAIPNPGTLDSVIEVPDAFRNGDVNCRVSLRHSSVSLVRVVLEDPLGTQVTLHDRSGSDNKLETTYDSQTQPDGPGQMSDFDGAVGTGTWHLYVTDFTGDTMAGGLDRWSLIFDTADLCHDYSCSDAAPPAVGDSLRLERLEGTDVRLTWATAAGAEAYNVWRSTAPNFADPVTVGHTTTTTFDELGLPHRARVYFYQVRAENGCREEGP